MEKKKIIYITGLGRSGSTIVDIVLGNNPNTVSCGEITNIFQDAYILNQICSCGQDGANCEYWQSLKKEWEIKSNLDINKFVKLTTRYEKNTFLAWLRYFFNYFLFQTKNFKQYLHAMILFMEMLFERNNADILIDSSKRILRFQILHSFSGYEILPIHLVRDLKGVMASEASDTESIFSKHMKFLKTIIRYIILNLQIHIALSRIPHKYLQYEDLLTNPRKEMAAIGILFDLDLSEAICKIDNHREFVLGHIISGSHIRTKNQIIIMDSPDRKWQKIVPRFYIPCANIITKYIKKISE